jgi:hypothetical protein
MPPSNGQTKGVTLKIDHDASADVPDYYVNNVEISHTEHEYTLSFVKMPSKVPKDILEIAKKNGSLTLAPMLKIYLPVTVMDGLILALTAQRDKYESKFGKRKAAGKK